MSTTLTKRFEAEIFDAQAIIYRPCLEMVLNRGPCTGVPIDVLDGAQKCILAMEESIKAFGTMIGGRLVLSNVWGIAHK
jgi:hypothetical protein